MYQNSNQMPMPNYMTHQQQQQRPEDLWKSQRRSRASLHEMLRSLRTPSTDPERQARLREKTWTPSPSTVRDALLPLLGIGFSEFPN